MNFNQQSKNEIIQAAKIDVWEAYLHEQKLILGDSISEWLGFSKNELTYDEFLKTIDENHQHLFRSNLKQLFLGNSEVIEIPIKNNRSGDNLILRSTVVKRETEENENIHLVGWLRLIDLEKRKFPIDPRTLSFAFDFFLSDRKINDVVEDVLKIILKQFNVSRVLAFNFDKEKTHQECICEVTATNCTKSSEEKIDESFDSVKWIMDSIFKGKPLILNNVDYFLNENKNKRINLRNKEIKSLMIVPLFHGENISGYMEMDTNNYRNWSTDEFRWFSAFANVISVCILLKKEKEEYVQAKTKAEGLSRLKSALLDNLGHEIRTSLNAIVGFSNILATTEKKSQKKEYLSIIENNNEVLLDMVSTIIDSSKIQDSSFELNESEFDVNSLLCEFEKNSKLKLANTDVEISFIERLPECKLWTDKNRFMQVINILFNNAIKSTQKGYIYFGYKLESDNMLHFYMSDSGCGISSIKAERFFQNSDDTEDFKTEADYVSLQICKVIVSKLGGNIGVNSVEGKGSNFWFTLPYTSIQKEDLKIAPKAEKKEDQKPIILIAEDDPGNYRLLEITYRGKYHIIHAWDGLEAINLFKTYNPNLILMDVRMSKVDGYVAVNEIRKLSKTIPIIAVTAYVYEEDEKKILNSGFDYYFAKPINKNDLEAKIEECLGSSK